MYLTQTELLDEIYREIDEPQSNSYFTVDDVIAYINRESDWLSSNLPMRLARYVITGDGVHNVYSLPEPVYTIITVTENDVFVLPRNVIELAAQNAFRTTLASDIYASYGVAFNPPNKLIFGEVLGNGQKRDVWAYGHTGHLNNVFDNGTVVTANATKDDKVLSNLNVLIDDVNPLDTIEITDSNGRTDIYIIQDKTASSITLTEPYRGNTEQVTITIGNVLSITPEYKDLIIYGVLKRLARKERDTERELLFHTYYQNEKRNIRARQERIQTLGRQRLGGI